MTYKSITPSMPAIEDHKITIIIYSHWYMHAHAMTLTLRIHAPESDYYIMHACCIIILYNCAT